MTERMEEKKIVSIFKDLKLNVAYSITKINKEVIDKKYKAIKEEKDKQSSNMTEKDSTIDIPIGELVEIIKDNCYKIYKECKSKIKMDDFCNITCNNLKPVAHIIKDEEELFKIGLKTELERLVIKEGIWLEGRKLKTMQGPIRKFQTTVRKFKTLKGEKQKVPGLNRYMSRMSEKQPTQNSGSNIKNTKEQREENLKTSNSTSGIINKQSRNNLNSKKSYTEKTTQRPSTRSKFFLSKSQEEKEDKSIELNKSGFVEEYSIVTVDIQNKNYQQGLEDSRNSNRSASHIIGFN